MSAPLAPPPGAPAPAVVDLADPAALQVALVGGKAAGLARLVADGERVPPGYCLTPDADDGAAVAAYRRLGGGRVAVRSSAVAEDLPHASFAGQHDTVLDAEGEDALRAAVARCRASLTGPRATAYREATGTARAPARMGVVVQRMVDAAVAGVLFTANPVTGSRLETVVDAVAGRGDAVVDGSVTADHHVLGGPRPVVPDGGCLTAAQLALLETTGRRLERRAGGPVDVEWAFDAAGELWLLQSRPVTTLFPLPRSPRPGDRVYLEVGHLQGMLRPFTPMGMAAMRVATASTARAAGLPADPHVGHPGLVDVAGRMYLDLTALVRHARLRRTLPAALAIYGPRVGTAVERVLEDPRFAPVPGRPWRLRTVARVGLRVGPGLLAGTVGALATPARARRRAQDAAAAVERSCWPAGGTPSTVDRLRRAATVQGEFLGVAMRRMLPPIYAALLAKEVAAGLLEGVAGPGEIEATLRGMPHNPTTEMDLALYRLAADAAPAHRALLRDTPPAELAARHLAGDLPDLGLAAFLGRYGHRAAGEVDVGVPRWAEDPTPVFAAIAGYLAADDGPDPARRFARAADEAAATIDALVRRALPDRPVRARAAGFLLRRSREIAGLRELPKSAWLHAFAEMRRQLLAVGADLHARGLLDRPDDVMFLDLREALGAAGGADHRALVAARRAEHERERHRRAVPGLLLSDGTVPEALAPAAPAADGVLTGMPAAPGTVTGPVRVVLDPAAARVEPGEILVAPTTDPGWTPLFLTAGGLVTETGSPMAHGPTVAREYGIPAVICVRDATRALTTGQVVTVDGAAGTVTVDGGDRAPVPG